MKEVLIVFLCIIADLGILKLFVDDTVGKLIVSILLILICAMFTHRLSCPW